MLQGRFDLFRYLDEVQEGGGLQPAFKERIHANLMHLKQLLDYPVGVIEFETDDYREANAVIHSFQFNGKATEQERSVSR